MMLTIARTYVRYLWALPNTLIGLAVLPLLVASGGHAQVVNGVLELHGGLVTWLLRRLVPLRGGAVAVTLGHVVLGRDRHALALTRLHERAHVRQYESWGPAFIPAYLAAGAWALCSGHDPYADNYFERRASAQESTGPCREPVPDETGGGPHDGTRSHLAGTDRAG